MRKLSEETARCIRCGFCLEACPTFLLTGSELESPRGRIGLARAMDEGDLDPDAVRPHLDRCLGCLACEPACPSGVRYGSILESARARLGNAPGRRALLAVATSPAAMRAQAAAGGLLGAPRMPGFLARLLGAAPERPEVRLPLRQPLDLPPFREAECPPVRGEVYLLEGCAMRALHPRVHEATRRLLRRAGFAVRAAPGQGCCGSMHAHLGELESATKRAHDLAAAMPGDVPVVTDSAGCGSQMKRYAELDPALAPFAARVRDAAEFLHAEGFEREIARSPGLRASATYHDACHLAHGQGIVAAPRALLAAIPGLDLRPLEESDLCCGSAGVYNVLQPEMAGRLLDRKMARVAETGAAIAFVGNPGCHAWMEQGARERRGNGRFRPTILHTVEGLELSFHGPQTASRLLASWAGETPEDDSAAAP